MKKRKFINLTFSLLLITNIISCTKEKQTDNSCNIFELTVINQTTYPGLYLDIILIEGDDKTIFVKNSVTLKVNQGELGYILVSANPKNNEFMGWEEKEIKSEDCTPKTMIWRDSDFK